jgi:hypothetical protein
MRKIKTHYLAALSALALLLTGCAHKTTGTISTEPSASVSRFQSIDITSEMQKGLTLNRAFEPVCVIEFTTHNQDAAVPEAFGGLSSMRLLSLNAKHIRFEVVSDNAHIGVIDVPNPMGKLKTSSKPAQFGQTIIRMIPLIGPDGQPLTEANDVDAEGIAPTPDGRLISLERNHRLLHLSNKAFKKDGVTRPGPNLIGFDGLESNGGMEGLARLPDGRYLAITEYGRQDQGKAQGLKPLYWIFDLKAKGQIAPIGHFDNLPSFGITEARIKYNRLWLLKRSWVSDSNITLRLESCPIKSVLKAKPECQLEMSLTQPFPMDNYEGLEILKDKTSGDYYFFILSDDNFSATQTTRLLTFRLKAQAMPR